MYQFEKLKEVNQWRVSKNKALYPNYKSPNLPAKPMLGREFIYVFAEFMNIKTKLLNNGYSSLWDKWSLTDLLDSGFIIILDEISKED